MGDRSGMSISADSPSDETLNRGPLALLLWRQYEYPFGINIVQFLIFSFFFLNWLHYLHAFLKWFTSAKKIAGDAGGGVLDFFFLLLSVPWTMLHVNILAHFQAL